MLINDNEEIKIIKKLEESDQTVDKDFLIDLENYRNYSYVNFRDFKDYGIKFRPKKTIEAVRVSSFLSKKIINLT